MCNTRTYELRLRRIPEDVYLALLAAKAEREQIRKKSLGIEEGLKLIVNEWKEKREAKNG